MKKIGIIYGSTTGTTDGVAQEIASQMGVAKADIHDVTKINADLIGGYDVLILGTSTWGDGELQDDWYDGVKVLKSTSLAGKQIALFGCGDSDSYADTFCDGIGQLYEELQDTGATFIGAVEDSGYTYSCSKAIFDDKFVGLPIDEVNESGETGARIEAWVATLKSLI